MVPPEYSPASAGVVAAALLADACRMAPEEDLRARTVEDLALDLGRRLRAARGTHEDEGRLDPLVEAAQACGDLATLGACNVSGLPAGARPLAAAATHLAAGTARALQILAEAEADDPDTPRDATRDGHAANALRDVRSAGWKADLAVRQLTDAGEPG